jgi:phosphomethylpyrimidine synthase
MLGPITTDVAPGYDHITSAIGAALSSAYGADFICYVTPPEHLALPYPEDVKEGLISAKIATYIGDMVKYKNRIQDLKMAHARQSLNWEKQFEIAITSERARAIYNQRIPVEPDTCTMCGKYCAIRMVNQEFGDIADRCQR